MSSHDQIQRFLFDEHPIRGEIVHLNKSYQSIITQHAYPDAICTVLGECLVAAVLLSATIKYEGTLTIQIESDGPIQLLLAKSTHEYQIRGLTQWDQNAEITDHFSDLKLKRLIMTIQTGKTAKIYQSIIDLKGKTISEAIEEYLARSEQIPSRLILLANQDHAAGILLQSMPEPSSHDREQFWEHALVLTETLSDDELFNLSNVDVLYRLFHEEPVRVFEPSTVSFHCPCSINKMENAIRLMGKEDALDILKTKRFINVTCEFCSDHYEFDKETVLKIFSH